jgi:hypothetical protein
MNTLSNGSIAVGAPRSWMRLQAAYEHELEKIYGMRLQERAYCQLFAVMEGDLKVGDAMKAAAVACGVKPTSKAVREYLIAAFRDLR